MSTRAIIGITMPDGRIIAARVAYDGGDALLAKLEMHYNSRERAAALVNLGDILIVGDTPRECELGPKPEPFFVANDEAFLDLVDVQIRWLHLFDSQNYQDAWASHYADEDIIDG